MSAPDPKDWEEPDDDPETLAFAYGIARRRALAELKALAATAERVGGEDWSDCMVGQILIHDRIAEIEAEG